MTTRKFWTKPFKPSTAFACRIATGPWLDSFGPSFTGSGEFRFKQGETDMGDKGKKDKGKREQQTKAQHNLKEKRKQKKEKKK
ncbi:MAG: hypothetical protein V3R83_11735 [Gammaproteobacteria bacterium]